MKAILGRDVNFDEIKIIGFDPDKNLFPAGMKVDYITTENKRVGRKIIPKAIVELKNVRLAMPTGSIVIPRSHYISS